MCVYVSEVVVCSCQSKQPKKEDFKRRRILCPFSNKWPPIIVLWKKKGLSKTTKTSPFPFHSSFQQLKFWSQRAGKQINNNGGGAARRGASGVDSWTQASSSSSVCPPLFLLLKGLTVEGWPSSSPSSSSSSKKNMRDGLRRVDLSHCWLIERVMMLGSWGGSFILKYTFHHC